MHNQHHQMNIQGLDYNTQREKLIMPEYGREVQWMVQYAISLPDKRDRQSCARAIINTMERMHPQVKASANYKQKLWDQLALISEFKLDIDWPYDISKAKKILGRPEPMKYPMQHIPVRHYGKLVFELFEQLKTMEPGPRRDRLMAFTANQMKRDLMQWSHGSSDNEKVASDLARFTDGKIQLDLDTFRFAKIELREPERKRKRK